MIGFFTGIFRFTNFWDFPIYYVVCGSIFFFVLLRAYQGEIMKFIVMMLGIAAVMLGVGLLSALPFTLTFDTISTSVGLTHSHSLLHQLLVLWWFPAACLTGFIVQLILERREMKRTSPHALWKVRKMALPDLAVLMFGLCAAGLVFLPEVIYVKDIYSSDHYRANTMFKLTYQAFILFGMCMAYILTRAVVTGTDRLREAAAARAAQNSSGELPAGSSLKKSSAESKMRELGDLLTARDVCDLGRDGDLLADEVMETVSRYLGLAISHVEMTVDPDVFIIGGGVSRAGSYLLEKVRKYYNDYTTLSRNHGNVVLAALGNDAGIYGAVRLVMKKAEESKG